MTRRAGNLPLTLMAIALISACDAGDDAEHEGQADTTVEAGDTTPAAAASADERFLTQMADHHEGLVLMAQRAQERAQDDALSAIAEQLERTHVAERDSVLALLSNAFEVDHTPQAMERHRAKADSITGLPIDDHDRYFLRNVISHHRESIAMVDLLEPSFENADVRAMAERMKASLEAEVTRLEARRGSL